MLNCSSGLWLPAVITLAVSTEPMAQIQHWSCREVANQGHMYRLYICRNMDWRIFSVRGSSQTGWSPVEAKSWGCAVKILELQSCWDGLEEQLSPKLATRWWMKPSQKAQPFRREAATTAIVRVSEWNNLLWWMHVFFKYYWFCSKMWEKFSLIL